LQPEVEFNEYWSSKKYSSNFWSQILEGTRVLAAALIAVKAVSKVGKFSDIAYSITSCLVVGIFMPKTA